MGERLSKYIRLFGTIFLVFVGFIAANLLLLLLLRLTFGFLDKLPVMVYIYMLFIITVPAALFITVYIIYFQRTKYHPSVPVRYFSYAVFTIALLMWGTAYVSDVITFFKHSYGGISYYKSYELAFLAGNVGAIFLVGIIQALSAQKEVDWMEKHKILNQE
ncbi:hypothetical protein [Ferruginibacter sp. HRS2-29]|uniref:hypothetical protein n=1 Tax=Ferruginibacter sp. HRS2-29 TaxID=2487334 RepID=UPI0020CD2318|nr:hypothetical protein [Ferruginibacter sp. HRS2-29]MCP9751092.1 hypothetical protein [Ferruginibacter sp. HRS2-29]